MKIRMCLGSSVVSVGLGRYWSVGFLLWLFCCSCVVEIVSGQACSASSGVCDRHERCPIWKEEGECLRNRVYMQEHCPASCEEFKLKQHDDETRKTIVTKCEDQHDRCPIWAELGECQENPKDMLKYCTKSCNACHDPKLASSNDQQKDNVSVDDDQDNDDDVDQDNDDQDDVENYDEDEEDACVDRERRCHSWAKAGECTKNANYMLANCAKSCNACQNDDDSAGNSQLTKSLLEQTNAFGVQQEALGEERLEILKSIRSTIAYMQSAEVLQLPQPIRKECKNRHELCTFWQVLGECQENKAYMETNCAAACQTCQMIDYENRCPKLPQAIPGLVPGGLNQMFQRIVDTAPGNRTHLTPQELTELEDSKMNLYTVHVHSRPSLEPLTQVSIVQDKTLPPWVITLENFLTEEECEAMIQLGFKYKYERSEDVGQANFDGSFGSVKSEGRTSENAWCSHREGCRDEPIPKLIHDRIAKILGIPPENSEDFQILKYEKGQFYRTHHDYIEHQKSRQCGPRMLTFFMYLSDVEEGGGTNFPNLDITVSPKKGRALLWPSVLDSDPSEADRRLQHQALPVVRGSKFAVNAWIHLYDYMGAHDRGCT